MKRLVGRGDLLRVVQRVGVERLRRSPWALGFQHELPAAIQVSWLGVEVAGSASAFHELAAGLTPPTAPSGPRRLVPVPFWRVASVRYHPADPKPGDPARVRRDLEPGDLAHPALMDARAPVAPPIRSWPRLWPRLFRSLCVPRPSAALDLARLLDAWCRCRPLARVPRRMRALWPERLFVLIDRSVARAPLHADQRELLGALAPLLAKANLELAVLPFGIAGPVFDPRSGKELSLESAAQSEVVLGLGAEDARSASPSRDWRALGRSLRAQRVRPVMLAASGGEHGPEWERIAWDADPSYEDPAESAHLAARLLALASPAARIPPGLLRALRLLLGAPLSVELRAWNDPRALERTPQGIALIGDAESEERWKAAFLAEPLALRRAALAHLRAWHAALWPELWCECALRLAAWNPGLAATGDLAPDLDWARRFGRRVLASVLPGEAPAGARVAVEAWVRRLGDRSPDAISADESLAALNVLARRSEERVTVARTVDLTHLDELLGEPGPDETRELVQEGAAILRRELAPRGSPLCSLTSGHPLVHVVHADERVEQWNPQLAERLELPPQDGLELRTDRMTARLELLHRPSWASDLGRDRFGMWAEVCLGAVRFRLRWIPPGRFWMGSPETEEGRYDHEGPRQLVEIPADYWLGEVPVTQALWSEVMEENPSRFRSPGRPVEQVSWDRCQEFLRELEKRVPGLGARLPREAEWEHACRAGTDASSFAGEVEILGMNDAPRLDAIAWYGGNSGKDFDLAVGESSSGWSKKQYPHTRAGTREVRSKLPNGWGLHDMLGNVYEWCADEYGAYPGGEAMPWGSERVVRGGAWRSRARLVRAAYRDAYHPGGAHSYLGLRLARGHGCAPAGEPEARAAPAEPVPRGRRGTRRRGPK